MDVDDCYARIVGNFGRFQIITYAVFSIYLFFLTSHTLLVVFAGAKPAELRVVNPRVEDDSSILVEWDLAERPWISDAIQSFYFAGNLVGVILFGQLSDKYGRRPVLITGFLILFPVCMCTSMTSSWQAFATARCLTGLFQGGASLVLYIYMQEIVGQSWWSFTGAFTNVIFALGIGVMSLSAYTIPAWRKLTQFVTYPQLIPLIYLMFIPESPRWLYSVGRLKEAEDVLNRMARQNGVTTAKSINLEKKTVSSNKTNLTLIDLFKHKKTLFRTLIMLYAWFVNSFVYYAMTLAAGNIGSNTYISATLSGLVELPSTLICTVLVERRRFGRKRTLVGCMLISGLTCGCIFMLSNSNTILFASLIGKMAIAAGFNIVYVYTPELYPTPVRNVALGSCAMLARFGAMAAPMTKSMNPVISNLVFGGASVSGAFLSSRLPETLGLKPPDTFEDLDKPQHSNVIKA